MKDGAGRVAVFEAPVKRGAFLDRTQALSRSYIAYCNDYVYHGRLLPKKRKQGEV